MVDARPEPLRILHVAEALGGGILELVRFTAGGQARAGNAAAVAYGVRPETPERLRSEFDPAVELFPMPWTDRSLRAQAGAVRALRRTVAAWQPDVVHLHSSFAGVVGALAVAGRVPTVYTPQAASFTQSSESRARLVAFRAAERFVARRVDVVGASSRTEAEQMRAAVRPRRLEVVENGIPELDEPPPERRDWPDPPRVLAIGRTVPQRQPEACARILGRVAGAAEIAWVGGGGGERGVAGHEALVRAGVPVTGWVTREEVLQRLAEATIYLHWTAWDGLPVSILDALAVETVVVASDIGPNREVLGASGVCADEMEAVARIEQLVTNPSARDELLAAQRERRGHYSARRMVAGWMDVYRDLVGRAGR
jgi:glycosyltransferase involved in cell wall biosynthesis